jgi:hypothetical protein
MNIKEIYFFETIKKAPAFGQQRFFYWLMLKILPKAR